MHGYGPGTALIVVDVQNDFADPDGSLSVPGAEPALAAINREIAVAVGADTVVVATQDWHPEHTPHFAQDGGRWPVHCVAGTWGADLHPALELPEAAPRVRKGANGEDGYSGFTMRDPRTGATAPTELEGILRGHAVDVATDYCVKATALDALRLGFATIVLTDAVAAVEIEPGDSERALDELRGAGVVLRPSLA
jgi:nicotinamidase/pyrazinamidase